MSMKIQSTYNQIKESIHYLCNILRYQQGQEVILFNSQDVFEYLAQVDDQNPKATRLEILASSEPKH